MPNGTGATPAQIVRAIMEATSLGMADARQAMRDAEENLGGDYVLAALVRHAHGFAINVKAHSGMTQEEARRAWDLEWAEESRELSERPEWETVRRMSDAAKAAASVGRDG